MIGIPRKERHKNQNQYSFFNSLKNYGIHHIVFSWDTFISIFVVGVVYYFKDTLFPNSTIFYEMVEKLVYIFISVGASLFAIVLTALAVMTALTNGKLIGLLSIDNTLTDLLLPFWVVSFTWGFTVILGVILYIIILAEIINATLIVILFFMCLFIFIFSIIATVSLTGHTIRIILETALFYRD